MNSWYCYYSLLPPNSSITAAHNNVWNVYRPSVKRETNDLKQTKASTQDTQSPASPSFLPLPAVKPAPVQILGRIKEWRNRWKDRKRERERRREKESPGHPCVLHENGIGFRNLLRSWRSSYMALWVTCLNWTWGRPLMGAQLNRPHSSLIHGEKDYASTPDKITSHWTSLISIFPSTQ